MPTRPWTNDLGPRPFRKITLEKRACTSVRRVQCATVGHSCMRACVMCTLKCFFWLTWSTTTKDVFSSISFGDVQVDMSKTCDAVFALCSRDDANVPQVQCMDLHGRRGHWSSDTSSAVCCSICCEFTKHGCKAQVCLKL